LAQLANAPTPGARDASILLVMPQLVLCRCRDVDASIYGRRWL